jgi:hypothetical protein
MTPLVARTFETPGESDLGLRRITNSSGLSVSVLPNGCVFAIEHQHERGRTLINQVQGSALDGGIARLYLRIRAPEPAVAEAVGPRAKVSFGATADRFTWDGTTAGVRHSVSLWLHPQHQLWLWRVYLANAMHNRHVVLRAKEQMVASPRDHPPQRPGHAARRDDALCDLLDARGVRHAAHDRQHVLSQALLGRATILAAVPTPLGGGVVFFLAKRSAATSP